MVRSGAIWPTAMPSGRPEREQGLRLIIPGGRARSQPGDGAIQRRDGSTHPRPRPRTAGRRLAECGYRAVGRPVLVVRRGRGAEVFATTDDVLLRRARVATALRV